MLKVSVQSDGRSQEESSSFELESQEGRWLINGQAFDGDIAKLSENKYHVIWNYKSYLIEVTEQNISAKTLSLVINGQKYATVTKDRIDLLLEGMGLQAKVTNKINHLKAPMPGLIQSVAVKEGDKVTKGDILLVLVAMKMENVIRAAGDGIVKSMKIIAGQTVEKNQVMLEFE
ncbi:acetyl-CoA carboxylase biotin carboxyl carrier protein subunit [Dyadobacter luteus]|uniref:Acetyl-CoA carboxylase biotin carboxyl carrier protein subunit n=1 Tax=Dyadobacter luteus TaxID=2259619 RepID=A0A3D8Y6D8_9BACT|nr:biotin/lipoyl-containing protein [Dyadobacter luteus]REA58359.1 acetyl-CoA carboxylase biotin carboxyl carrier protein subunit [Dyadobacter luteus]